jgi:hypothetical protein
MCSTLRPAGVIVHGEARGESVYYSASAASPPCPLDRRMPTANTDGTSVGTSSVGRGVGRGCCEAAGGSAPASPPPRSPRASDSLPRLASACPCTRAAGAVFGFGCAAQRSVTRRCSGRPRRRRGAAAPRRCWNGHCARPSAAASPCTADAGGDSARRTQRPIRGKRKRRTRRRPGRSRRRRMRRAIGRFGDCRGTPPSAARYSHTCARRGRGAGVGPTGYPSTQTGTRKTKQHARPEGRLCCRFG